MRLCKRSLALATLIVSTAVLVGATPGSFRGTIVESPHAEKGWIYVQGRNGSARRVEIARAKIVYDEDVPAAERRPNPEEALLPGAEVRVTAEQGGDGEWHADRVEILKPVAGTERSSKQQASK